MALSDKENLEWLNNETGKSCIIQRWLKGGNNLLGEVSVGSEIKALKIYSSEQYDDRDRSGTEYKALRFLERNGCKSTPKPYLYSKVPPRLLMDWLDGEPAMSNIRDSDLVFSAEFLAFVAGASVYADDFEFDMASESCLSDQDILSHIESRILKLGHITELKPFFEQFNESLQSEITKASGFPWFSNALPKSKQTLIPADFSLHNVIRQNDGCLKVFDFEYFGWDDPVKGVADFLLHPGMTLSRADKQSFLSPNLFLIY